MLLTPNELGIFLVGLAAGAAGVRAGVRLGRRPWNRRPRRPASAPRLSVIDASHKPGGALVDSSDQLRAVMAAEFRARPILSRSETRVFEAAERVIRDHGLDWRVMAQVSLGEILACPDKAAFSAVNSKRVDILIVARSGHPVAAVEYQGAGHYQGSAPARDAIKKEALRKAGVRYIEVSEGDTPQDLSRAIARAASSQSATARRAAQASS
jgi:hypothetical protein